MHCKRYEFSSFRDMNFTTWNSNSATRKSNFATWTRNSKKRTPLYFQYFYVLLIIICRLFIWFARDVFSNFWSKELLWPNLTVGNILEDAGF